MRAIFCGTPEIAVPALEALAEIAEIVGVVCQPDRPAGRGMKLRSPAVKVRSLEMGITPYQPTKVRDGSLAAWMKELSADVALVIAYGRILNEETLNAPRLGCVNLHASILPQYRGAAPIQRAIMDGRRETGVCLMKMDEGMDTGDILAVHRIPIESEDNTGSLGQKLGVLAAEVTRDELPRYVRGELTTTKQDEDSATYAPPLTRDDSPLDFKKDALQLENQIRGLSPRPGASATLQRSDAKPRRFKILSAHPALSNFDKSALLAPGEVQASEGKILIGTGTIPLLLQEGQLEGKKAQKAVDIFNGRGLISGDQLA